MMSRLTMDISISHQVLHEDSNILTFILEFVLIKTLNDRGVDVLSHPQLLLDLSYFLYRYPGYHLPRVLPFIGPNFLAGCNNPICKRLKASVSSSTMQALLEGRCAVILLVSSACLLLGQILAIPP